MRKLHIVLIITTLFACNVSKKSINEKPYEIVTKANNIYRFKVSFISLGSGVDTKAIKNYREYIENYSIKNNLVITYDLNHWGKEGETDFCIMLSDLNIQQQKEFILSSKEFLKITDLVRYSENQSC